MNKHYIFTFLHGLKFFLFVNSDSISMAEMDTSKSKPERKSFFFSAKFPKFHLNFGSGSRTTKNKILENSEVLVRRTKEEVPKNLESMSTIENENNFSSNLSLLSSKLSTKSPNLMKSRKNFINACEKQCSETFAVVTASKISILKAKMGDDTSTTLLENPSQIHRTTAEKSKLNFMNEIKNPDVLERAKNKSSQLLSINTEEFLTKFLAEKGSNRPVVQQGLVKERAKVFEQKIGEASKASTSFKPNPSSYSLRTNSEREGYWSSSFTNSTTSAQSINQSQVKSLSLSQAKSPHFSWSNKGNKL